jgi:hypothetical protein
MEGRPSNWLCAAWVRPNGRSLGPRLPCLRPSGRLGTGAGSFHDHRTNRRGTAWRPPSHSDCADRLGSRILAATWLHYDSCSNQMGGMGGMRKLLLIEIGAGTDSDAEEVELLRLGLRRELLELDIDAADGIVGNAVPHGAKGHSADTAGALVVTLSNSAVIVALVSLLRSWVGRGAGRRVTIRLGEDSIDVSRTSPEQQATLIESWLAEHGRE